MNEYLRAIPLETWAVLCDMAPYLLFGFLMAGILSVLISQDLVERHLGGHSVWSVFKATLFGIPLPLCSCGVIPVAASLRKHGANRGATAAFFLSTPQTGVDSILVTLGLLGFVFAIFRALAAFVSGIAAGFFVLLFGEREGSETGQPPACEDSCCNGEKKHGKLYQVFHYGFSTLPGDVAKPLLVGLLVAACITSVVPPDFFSRYLGSGILSMLVMILLGIPVYVCATASVPVAVALIAKGISPGAALVFLMTGPATNAASFTTIWKMLGRRTAVIYLLTVALTALAAGVTLDYLYTAKGTGATPEMPWMLPEFLKTASALLLLAILAASIWRKSSSPVQSLPDTTGKHTATFSVKGMTCNHCVESVGKALGACVGIEYVNVDIGSGTAIVKGGDFDIQQLLHAVGKSGYNANLIHKDNALK